MTAELKKTISNHFATLMIDVDRDADLARGYVLLLLCNYCFGETKPIQIDVTDTRFLNLLERTRLPFFVQPDTFAEEQQVAVESLVALFQSEKLFKNYRSFFDCYSPFIVDWDQFLACFSKNATPGNIISVLAFLLSQDESVRKPREIYSPFRSPIESDLHAQNEFLAKWAPEFKMKSDELLNCAKAVFIRPTRNIPVKISGLIKNAIDKYSARKVPMERLLIDYYLVKTHSDSTEEAVNPWAYILKGIRKIPVESHVSIAETLFDLAAYPMLEERPTDVIRSLFYKKSVSDSNFECSFFLSEFCKMVQPGSNVLIVHPSPDMILAWNSHGDWIKTTTVYAVPTSEIAELYSLEFPDKKFISFDQITEQNSIDHVLITPRNLPWKSIDSVLHSLTVCGSNAEILGLFPNALFDENYCDVRNKLLENQLTIHRMILVSSQVVSSSPRKKVLMYLRKSPSPEAGGTIQTWSLTAWKSGSYYISKDHFSIPIDEFWKGGYSINTLLSRAVQRKKQGGDPQKTKTLNAAKEYLFSGEITLHYTIISDRKNRFAGKAYYRSCIEPESTTRKRGKKLTETIEAGLRDKTEAGVIKRLEQVPFDERIYPFIVADIREKYQENPEDLSLKTLWFCLIPQLQRSKKYDEALCFSMFCGDKQELSVLISSKAKSEDYIDALGCLFTHESKQDQLQYWVQLDLIFKHAISSGYVRFNPISEMLSAISSQATEEQREVRNALTKKTFSSEEEQRLLDYITAFTDKSNSSRRFEQESIWLAGAIKMFTGMSTREVCALQWKDFIQIPGTDVYQFILTKYADDKGNSLQYQPKDEAKKIRKIPVSPMLALLLQKRHLYLTNTMKHENFQEEPIVLRSEKRGGPLFATPRHVTKKCQFLLEQAQISENLLILPDAHGARETDINRYHGDIFLSNFRYRANHTCALTRGELNYILGIEPPDTFSRHYCDYAADIMQYAVAKKLLRWCKELPSLAKMWYRKGKSASRSIIVVNPHPDENAALDLIIDTASDKSSQVKIEIDCELGFSCHAICLAKGDTDER